MKSVISSLLLTATAVSNATNCDVSVLIDISKTDDAMECKDASNFVVPVESTVNTIPTNLESFCANDACDSVSAALRDMEECSIDGTGLHRSVVNPIAAVCSSTRALRAADGSHVHSSGMDMGSVSAEAEDSHEATSSSTASSEAEDSHDTASASSGAEDSHDTTSSTSASAAAGDDDDDDDDDDSHDTVSSTTSSKSTSTSSTAGSSAGSKAATSSNSTSSTQAPSASSTSSAAAITVAAGSVFLAAAVAFF